MKVKGIDKKKKEDMNYDNCIKNKRAGIKLEISCSADFVKNERVSFYYNFFFIIHYRENLALY